MQRASLRLDAKARLGKGGPPWDLGLWLLRARWGPSRKLEGGGPANTSLWGLAGGDSGAGRGGGLGGALNCLNGL